MALRNIIKDDDPGLSKKSRVVTDFSDRLHILLDDMRQTLIEAKGLGLAAPQVGVLRRVILVVDSSLSDTHVTKPLDSELPDTEPGLPDSELPDTEPELPDSELPGPEPVIIELINPELLSREGEQCGQEGCLSLPGIYGIVSRPQTVTVRAQDRFGESFELEVSDMTARAMCHEIDHLDGIVFTSIAERILTPQEIEDMQNGESDEGNI